jgi:hypothetical protein
VQHQREHDGPPAAEARQRGRCAALVEEGAVERDPGARARVDAARREGVEGGGGLREEQQEQDEDNHGAASTGSGQPRSARIAMARSTGMWAIPAFRSVQP